MVVSRQRERLTHAQAYKNGVEDANYALRVGVVTTDERVMARMMANDGTVEGADRAYWLGVCRELRKTL